MVDGRKPKDDGAKVTRHPLTHDWIEVPNVPYNGPRPTCPVRTKATLEWWADVTTMPQCAIWTAADWRFVVDTARLHSEFVRGKMNLAAEVRIREQMMGTTDKARRDLRIRYVSPEQEVEAVASSMRADDEERWRRIIDEDA